jgi:hypothetical protein
MAIHDPENWKLARPETANDDDQVNCDVWRDSGQVQQRLADLFPLDLAGSIGGQQAMLPTGGSLPWVPDLVGTSSDGKNSVMIIGSAYAPFVHGFSGRNGRMEIGEYVRAQNWADFTSVFLETVLLPDTSYYRKIEAMFSPPENPQFWKKVILTDWCRASFVKRGEVPKAGPRNDRGGDPLCRNEGSGIFFSYVAQNSEWHAARLKNFCGKVVLLGALSHECLDFFCQLQGWRVDYVDLDGEPKVRPTKTAEFWSNDNANISRVGRIHVSPEKRLEFVVVSHPCARRKDVWPKSRNLLLDWVA